MSDVVADLLNNIFTLEHISILPLTLPSENDKKKKKKGEGSLGGAAVWRLPLAQSAILETWDRIPCRAPSAWSLLLPLPVSLPLSLSL